MDVVPAELGIFARVFPVQPAADLAALVGGLGFEWVQLNLTALGHPTVPDPDDLDTIDLSAISVAFEREGVGVWGLSATYNMAHPDAATRSALTQHAAALISRSPSLGVRAVSLCTGTRDPDDQWRGHPDNDSEAAWADMLASFDLLLPAAHEAGVLLAVEPEPANIVRDVDAGIRLLAELGASADLIGFILDPANLVSGVDVARHEDVLVDAFARLGPRVVCVHAKDVVPWEDRLAGRPGLDFDLVARLYHSLPSRVPMVIQDPRPADVARVRDLLVAALGRGDRAG